MLVPTIGQVPEVEQTVKNYIKEIFGSQSDTAIKVFTCESNLNKKAIHYNDGMVGYHAFGIAQIHEKF